MSTYTERMKMSTNISGTIVDWLFKFIVWPMDLTYKNQHWFVRLLGLLAFFVWCLPAVAVIGLPMLMALFAEIVESTIRGEA